MTRTPTGSLVVFGDSLAFLCGTRALLPDDERLYPQRVGSILAERTGRSWTTHAEVRAGWSVLTLDRALAADPGLLALAAGADALVIGVGTMDATPAALPGRIGFGVRDASTVRRRVTSRRRKLAWKAFARTYPALIRASGARFPHTPPDRLAASWTSLVAQLRAVAPQAALCGVLPAPHRCALYAGSMRHHSAAVSATRTAAGGLGLSIVDLPALVGDSYRQLPDGIHFTPDLHRRVAEALADALVGQISSPTDSANPQPS
ncbi:MAG: SGNH/GDSL hydrolase family protein [Acidimicrobiales bacterium]